MIDVAPLGNLDIWGSRMLHKCRPAGETEEHIFTAHFIDDPEDIST